MSKKYKIKKENKCEICKEKTVTAPEKTCKLCNMSMAVVTNMLKTKCDVPESHGVYPEYVGAVFASLKERRDILQKMTGDRISFASLAILESTEAQMNNRGKWNYTPHMTQENVIKACFHDDHGRLPIDEEFSKLKETRTLRLIKGKSMDEETCCICCDDAEYECNYCGLQFCNGCSTRNEIDGETVCEECFDKHEIY